MRLERCSGASATYEAHCDFRGEGSQTRGSQDDDAIEALESDEAVGGSDSRGLTVYYEHGITCGG